MLLILVLEAILSCSLLDDAAASGVTLLSEVHPDFTGPIDNVTAAIGREAVLSCRVADLGHYKVGWMKADDQTVLTLHTRVITHNPRISVTHDNDMRIWQLRIRQLKDSDAGCYMCQINTAAMKKTVGCIDVQVPPDIDDVETSTDMTVSEGDNVTLVCRATGHPQPRILWRREDGNHILYKQKPSDSDIDTFSGGSFTLVRVNRRQMGAYLCIASNDVPPAVSKRITLNINFAPSVHVFKSLVGAPAGSSARLKCEVDAYPYTNNYWIKDQDENLINSLKHSLQEKRNGNKLTMIVTIHNITDGDYGTYRCYASSIMGKSDSAVRLYEIRTTTTSTTTTTTTTTTTEIPITESTSGYFAMAPTVMTRMEVSHLEEAHAQSLYPSVASAPLELETISARATRCGHAGWLLPVLLFLFR